MSFKCSILKIAGIVDGKILGEKDPNYILSGICSINNYQTGKISYVRNEKWIKPLSSLKGAIILLPKKLASLSVEYPDNTYILINDVQKTILNLQNIFYRCDDHPFQASISKTAFIHPSAKIAKDVIIEDFVYIGKDVSIYNRTKIMSGSHLNDSVKIGKDTHIYPNVYINKNCTIGTGCTIHPGAQIGVDGFRFEQYPDLKQVNKMLQVGGVKIGDRVEIGANCTIARATFEDDNTCLEDDVKLDAQVHIGHNARVGKRSLIAAQTCVSGSVIIGEDTWIGAGVTISNGVKIGNRVKVLLNAVVAFDITEKQMVSGFYALPHKDWKKIYGKLKTFIST